MIGIDRLLAFNYPRPELAAIGWCCLDNLTPVGELWTAFDGMRVPCLTGLPRPDVASQLDAPRLRSAGFLCRFPVPRSVEQVSLVARHNGLEEVVGELPGDWARSARHPELDSNDYASWLRTHEPELFWPSSEVGQRLKTLSWTPVVSVILPTYNTHLYHLHRCIESVTTQLYPHWELCIADDGSPDPRVRQYLLERAASEPRIRLSFSEKNRGISAASNCSIAASTGDFIVLLDHDDELHPSALLEVARRLNAHPDADLIFSDEDKIDQLGVRSFPAFKPEFDEDLLCGFDYLGHLVALRTSLVQQVGGFRSDADGAQDWDLLLRVTSSTEPDRIRHIPKPLYHWRMHEDSTALSLNAKPYAIRAWNLVLEHHLRSQESCSVREGLFLGSMRVVRELPNDTRVGVLTRVCDGSHQRRALSRTRAKGQVTFFEVILSSIHRADHPDTGALMTLEDLQSDVVVVVNCRIDSVNHHFIEELAAQALRGDCGVVAGTILDADGVLTAGLACSSDGTYLNPFAGLALGVSGYMGQAAVVRRVPSIAPHVFAFRTSLLQHLNGLASINEDSLGNLCADLVQSAHALGLKVLHTPYAVATVRTPGTTYNPRQGEVPPRELLLNTNLEDFSNVAGILRVGIP